MAPSRVSTVELAYGTTSPQVVIHPRPNQSRWVKGALGLSLVMTGVAFMNIISSQRDLGTTDHKAYKEFERKLHEKINDHVDPCEDFYEYACGGWLESTKLPPNANAIDTSFTVVMEKNAEIIEDIMSHSPPLIGPMYTSCIQSQEYHESAIQTVANQVKHIHSLNSTEELLEYAGRLYSQTGAKTFFDMDVTADEKNATQNVAQISQGGLTFPSKEYYDDADGKYSDLFVAYVKSLTKIDAFKSFNISEFAHRILNLEVAFAKASKTNADLRDPLATYNVFSLNEITTQFPHVAKFFQGSGALERLEATKSHILVPTPSFFGHQRSILDTLDNLDTLKSYLSFHLLDSQSSFLGEYYRQIYHDFHGTIQGLSQKQSLSDYCSDLTQTLLGDFVGQYYLDRVWDNATKVAAQTLVREIENSMEHVLERESWLDDETRKQALEKLHGVFNLVGGPDKVEPLPFEISSTDFFGNILHFKQLKSSNTIASIGTAVSPNSWGLTASTVNAYYDPTANKMVFPAAIMQSPFYSAVKLPSVANYARIGMVMGHELSHGFDDQGRLFDRQGNLHLWWSANVSHTYDEKAACLADQYSSFPVMSLDRTRVLGHVNGKLTLGENIADNGGLKLAYLAYLASKASIYQSALEKQNDAMTYFISFAQGWCEKRSDAYSELLLAIDPHSPGKWRVNGPLMNSQLFADTFQCPLGSPMNPSNKCVVW